MTVRYTEAAQEDIETAYEYLATEGSLATADRVIDAIVATCEDLGSFPHMGRRRPDLDNLGLEVRSIGERGYIVLYTVYEAELYIVRVIHQSRDLDPNHVRPFKVSSD